MRDITKNILELNIFKPLSINSAECNPKSLHLAWDESDAITIFSGRDYELVLCISYSDEATVNEYNVRLLKNELDIYGDIFLSDDVWSIYGTESEIIEQLSHKIKNINSDLPNIVLNT